MEYTLVGHHPSIEKIRELIQMVSDTSLSVLILGETGTGKEVVARLLHRASTRRERRFIKVNCAALPQSLLESELFGYEKGAFTGADRQKPGKFELASGGVMFLDEIGDMPLVLQAKLLNVLQSGEFSRLGGTSDVKVDAWVISATNHDLDTDMKTGVFREDLFYRLNIIKIELPPLRERREDIPLLMDYLIEKHRRDLGMDTEVVLDDRIKKILMDYHWPGNVRELSSVVLRLLIGDDPDLIKSEFIHNMRADAQALPEYLGTDPKAEGPQQQGASNDEHFPIESLKDIRADATRFIERRAILYVLNLTGWNKRRAAEKLQISYKALFNKLNEYGIRNAP